MFANRRDFLWQAGGLGGLALAHLLGRAESGAKPQAAKVKRIIQLFMNGGASPADTYDYKPKLVELDGKPFDPGGSEKIESVTNSPGFKVLKSPFKFQRHGQCGRWVSEVFPHTAKCVDDLAFSCRWSKTPSGPVATCKNTDSSCPVPGDGAWISYALGSLTDNLPAFVVLPDPKGLPYNNQGNFSSGFLPVKHGGVIIRPHLPAPVNDLRPPASAKFVTPESERAGLDLLNQLNRDHLAENPGDSRLEARIASYELAAKMQLSAPEVFDLTRETQAVRQMYGLDEKVTEPFGRNCLIARRMIERGVRFVQVWAGRGRLETGTTSNIRASCRHRPHRRSTDPRLLTDLKARN